MAPIEPPTATGELSADNRDVRVGVHHRHARAGLIALGACLVTPVGGALEARAAPVARFSVTTTDDLPGSACSARCSLRQAIGAADRTGGASTITFAVSGTITLTSGAPLHITGSPRQSLTIAGRGRADTVMDGGYMTGVLDIGAGATVAISSVTIQHGRAELGGGILNLGALSVSDSSIMNNTAAVAGGGIRNGSGAATLAVTNSSIAGNTAGVVGGGIGNATGTLTMTHSVVAHNTANGPGGGGGIATLGVTALTNIAVVGNRAVDHGGGVAIGLSTTTITNSLVTANDVTGVDEGNDGGGIANYATLVLSATVVADNHAGHDGGGVADEFGAAATLKTSAVIGNTSGHGGGGIAIEGTAESGDQPTMTLTHTAVVGNHALLNGGGILNPSRTARIHSSTITNNRPRQLRTPRQRARMRRLIADTVDILGESPATTNPGG
jgi:CSLREA domain-containing protein